MVKLNGLDLFSGIGGISLALEPYVRTIAYCEQDTYAQQVLLTRQAKSQIDRAPIWNDIRTLHADNLPCNPEIIFGGFPCQDLSIAGRGAGLAGERSGLFFEIVRLAKETRAPFLFLENVPAIRTRGLREVVRTLAEMGYDCRWTCVSAASVGAPHKRERWFLLAYADGFAIRTKQVGVSGRGDSSELGNDGSKESLADAEGQRWRKVRRLRREQSSQWLACGGEARTISDSMREGLEGFTIAKGPREKGRFQTCDANLQAGQIWEVEPDVGRVANGVSARVDRLRCLGNAVVPLQARAAFERLMGL